MSSYYFPDMKPKAEIFRSTYVSSTGSYHYDNWNSRLEGYGAFYWPKFCERFAEDCQFGLLRANAVVGIVESDWESVFRKVYNEESPFEGLGRTYLQGQLSSPWTFFASKLAKDSSFSIHYPPLCPEWLFPYGYDQRQYLYDLEVCWEKVHPDYYKPWATTRIGQDSPEIARLKKIGETARREIDDVARRGAQNLKR